MFQILETDVVMFFFSGPVVDVRSAVVTTAAGKRFLRLPVDDTAVESSDETNALQKAQSDVLIADIVSHGVSVIRNAAPNSADPKNHTMRAVMQYLHTLMKFPENVDLMDTEQSRCFHIRDVRERLKITDEMLRRDARNTRTQHIPRKNGSCRYGVCCFEAIQLCAHVAPLFNALYSQLFEGSAPKLFCIDTSLQTPV